MNNYSDFSQHGYQVLHQLGQNFVGGRITYKAIDIENQQLVIIKQFQKELQKIKPNWSYSWLGEAVTLSFMNREEEGLVAIHKALKIDSNNGNLWTNEGFLLMRLKRYQEAKRAFEKALEIEPYNPYAKRKLLKVEKKLESESK